MKIRLPAAYALALILALVAPGCGSNSSISPSQLWSGTVESLPVVGKDSSLELHSVRSDPDNQGASRRRDADHRPSQCHR